MGIGWFGDLASGGLFTFRDGIEGPGRVSVRDSLYTGVIINDRLSSAVALADQSNRLSVRDSLYHSETM